MSVHYLESKEIIDPRELWRKYKELAYGDALLMPAQEHECSSAFYAGIEAAFKVTEHYCRSKADTEDETVEKIGTFRKTSKLVALSQNPTGSQ